MGYRSTFVTVDENVEWPAWFVKKYADTVFFPASKGHRVIASRLELKAYGKWADLAKDIQRSLEGQEGRRSERPFVFVFLHEDGEIVRCSVSSDDVVYEVADSFERIDGPLAPWHG